MTKSTSSDEDLPSQRGERKPFRRLSPWWLPAGWIVLAGLCWFIEWGPSQPQRWPAGFTLPGIESHVLEVFDQLPAHPAGSPANDVVRERIEARLAAWGISWETHRTVSEQRANGAESEEIPLENIFFKVPGSNPGETERQQILIMAHYDSTPSGPGISDDAVGTAVLLETARFVKTHLSGTNDFWFLITDGEEYGLLGAERFAQEFPELVADVDVVINLEARGTSGRSLMFQTGTDNRQTVARLAGSLQRPATSSLFVEIYRRLPNDTDFTVFLNAGRGGYNFAYIGDVRNYHTPQDDWEHTSRRSVIHHGQNVIDLVQALAHEPLAPATEGDAVFCDWLGRGVFWWPTSWSFPWSLILTLVSGVWLAVSCQGVPIHPETVGLLSPSTHGWRAVAAAARMIGGSLAAAVAAGLLLYATRWEPPLAVTFPTYPAGWLMGIWGSAIAVYLLAIGSSQQSTATLLGVCLVLWNALGSAVALWLPGASYLWILPGTAGVLALSLASCGRPAAGAPWAALVFSLAMASFWLAIEMLFYAALGRVGSVLLVPRIFLCGLTWAPLVLKWAPHQRQVGAGLFGLASLICLAIAVVMNRWNA